MARLKVWTIKDIVDCLEQMQAGLWDCIIVIEGNRGTGKSTFAYKILSRVKCKDKFNPTKDLVYSRDDVLRAIANKTYGCILGDELINVAFNRDFYEEDQKQLLKAFNMYRDSCNIFIGCVPKFSTIDNQIQGLCKLRFTVIRRGFALVHMPLSSIYSKDKWDIRNNERIESKWGKRGIRNPKYGQLTTVVGVIRFSDLGKRQRKVYDAIKKRKRNRVFKDYETREYEGDSNTQFYDRLYKKVTDKQLTPKELYDLCYLSGKKYKTVREKLNTMLKEKGITTSLRDLISKNNVMVKKDGMGFQIE